MALDKSSSPTPIVMKEIELKIVGERVIRGFRCGESGGAPWLFLHGWLDNAASFIPMLSSFCEQIGQDVDLVAVDMAGHGRSDHRDSGYLLVDYAMDALLIADALGWSRFSLVGHSLGGYVSSIAAGTQRDRITRLVLLDISLPLGEEAIDAPAALEKSTAWVAERTTGAKAGGSALKVFTSAEEAAKQRAAKNIGGPMSLSNASLIASRGVVPSEGGVMWASDPKLLQPSRQYLTVQEATAFTQRIRCPTLVLLSADGIYYDLLRRGGKLPISAGSHGIPMMHVFGRPYGAFFFLLWLGLKACARLLSVISLGKAIKIDKFAAKVSKGWRIGSGFRTIPALRYEQVEKGGHHFHMTVPELTSQIISRWLKS